MCIGCVNYDSAAADACREHRADFILDQDKANFCDYFKPNKAAYIKQDNVAERQARSKPAALFAEELPLEAAENAEQSPAAEAERVLVELQRLFGEPGLSRSASLTDPPELNHLFR